MFLKAITKFCSHWYMALKQIICKAAKNAKLIANDFYKF